MSEGSFFMPGGLRSFTRGGKEKPGNPAAMGKKVKSTLVLIILKIISVFFLKRFYSFNWGPSCMFLRPVPLLF